MIPNNTAAANTEMPLAERWSTPERSNRTALAAGVSSKMSRTLDNNETRRDHQAGETLVEILVALVIIGLIVSAYLATYSTGALASKAHRDLVTADGVLRNYAESVKDAVSRSNERLREDERHNLHDADIVSIPDSRGRDFDSLAGQRMPVNHRATTAQSVDTHGDYAGSVTKQLVIDVRTP